jgi:hypothetical protein
MSRNWALGDQGSSVSTKRRMLFVEGKTRLTYLDRPFSLLYDVNVEKYATCLS